MFPRSTLRASSRYSRADKPSYRVLTNPERLAVKRRLEPVFTFHNPHPIGVIQRYHRLKNILSHLVLKWILVRSIYSENTLNYRNNNIVNVKLI